MGALAATRPVLMSFVAARGSGRQWVGVVAFRHADAAGLGAEAAAAKLAREVHGLLGFLTEEVEADQIAARGRLIAGRAGAFDDVGAWVRAVGAEVGALDGQLAAAGLAGGAVAARGRIGVADADRTGALITAAPAAKTLAGLTGLARIARAATAAAAIR